MLRGGRYGRMARMTTSGSGNAASRWPVSVSCAIMIVVWVPAACAQGQTLDDLFGAPVPADPPKTRQPRSPVLGMPADEPVAGPVAAPAQPIDGKPPQDPPSRADAEAAAARIRELYEEDVKRSAQPQQRPQVVAKILQEAKDPTVTPPHAHAMFALAVGLAEQGESVASLDAAVQAFGRAFKGVDRDGRLLAFIAALDRQLPRAQPDLLEAILGVNARLRAAERFEEATTAADVAASLIRKVDAAQAAAFRDRVADVTAETAAERDLAAAARAGREALAVDDSAAAAHLAVGLYAAFRGDWGQAREHFRNGPRDDLRLAVEADSLAASDVARACKAADAWRRIASVETTTVGDLATMDSPALPPPVRRAMKAHAASLYEQALARGIDDLLLRKEAEKRLKELRPGGAPALKPEPPVVVDRVPVFDADRFNRIEAERSQQWERFQGAVRGGDKQAYAAALQALNRIRPRWCAELSPLVRDPSLQARRDAIRQVVLRHGECADTHLCESYLHMLAGDRVRARESFDRAVGLVDRDSVAQVFSPRQLLDIAEAAILLGEFDTAERINNTVLKKRYPNDATVLQVQAMLFVTQKRPRFSDALEKLNAALDKTEGEDRGGVLASLAWLRAAAPLETNLRLPKAAESYADEALQLLDGRSWMAWRAKAELRASESNWDAALAALDQAEAMAPLIHADAIDQQRQSYRARKLYEIGR